MSESYQVIAAAEADSGALDDVLCWQAFLHRHLDWRSPADWLGQDPYLLLSAPPSEGFPARRTLAVLACPPDPPEVAWIRVFGFVPVFIHTHEAWQRLWQAALQKLEQFAEVRTAAAVIVDMPWLEEAMQASGFRLSHRVIGLERHDRRLPPEQPVQGFSIRTMTVADLDGVTAVDRAAFPPLWHYSFETLQLAYRQSGCATVALDGAGAVIGYQISMRSHEGIHLSRLAVHPHCHAGGVGYALTRDMLERVFAMGIHAVTVNTQDYNVASLGLYRKMGFVPENIAYPVYEFPIREVTDR